MYKPEHNLANFYVATLVAVSTGAAFALLFADPWMALCGCLIGAAAGYVRSRYMKSLAVRMRADNDIIWDVEVNRVMVGVIRDWEYAHMRQNVFADPRSYIGQLYNLLQCAFRAAGLLFSSLPVAAFWFILLCYLMNPNELLSALREFQTYSAKDVAGAIRAVAWFCTIVVFIFLLVAITFLSSKFGFVNVFAERTNEQLRLKLQVPATGEMRLVRLDNGVYRTNDEVLRLVPR